MSTYKVYGGVPTMETEKLNNLLTAAEGGASGSGLPEVTADDNGKVLTVVDGEWDKAESSGGGSGGGGILTVHLNVNEQELGALDKTWQEIHDAAYTIFVDEDENTHNKNLIGYVSFVGYELRDGGYIVIINYFDDGSSTTYIAQNANDYPTEYNENSGGGD